MIVHPRSAAFPQADYNVSASFPAPENAAAPAGCLTVPVFPCAVKLSVKLPASVRQRSIRFSRMLIAWYSTVDTRQRITIDMTSRSILKSCVHILA